MCYFLAMSKSALNDALRACHNNRSELARRLKTNRQTVQHWIKAGRVPWWRHKAVLEIAKEVRS